MTFSPGASRNYVLSPLGALRSASPAEAFSAGVKDALDARTEQENIRALQLAQQVTKYKLKQAKAAAARAAAARSRARAAAQRLKAALPPAPDLIGYQHANPTYTFGGIPGTANDFLLGAAVPPPAPSSSTPLAGVDTTPPAGISPPPGGTSPVAPANDTYPPRPVVGSPPSAGAMSHAFGGRFGTTQSFVNTGDYSGLSYAEQLRLAYNAAQARAQAPAGVQAPTQAPAGVQVPTQAPAGVQVPDSAQLQISAGARGGAPAPYAPPAGVSLTPNVIASDVSGATAPVRQGIINLADKTVGIASGAGTAALGLASGAVGIAASALGLDSYGAKYLATAGDALSAAFNLATKGYSWGQAKALDGQPQKGVSIPVVPPSGNAPAKLPGNKKGRITDGAAALLAKPVTDGERLVKPISLAFARGTSPLEPGMEVARSLAYRQRLVTAFNAAADAGNAREATDWLKRIAQIDAHITNAEGMQGVNSIRSGDFTAAERILSHYMGGIDVSILPEGGGKYSIYYNGAPSARDSKLTKTQLEGRLRSYFDQAYKTNMAAAAATKLEYQQKLMIEIAKGNMTLAEVQAKARRMNLSLFNTADGTTVVLDKGGKAMFALRDVPVQHPDGSTTTQVVLVPVPTQGADQSFPTQ